MLPRLFPFQSSLETIRAHHWRSFMDIYAGCEFNCQYCLYRAAPNYGAHVTTSPLDKSGREPEGIVDIGAATDPYQPIEARQQNTRRVLHTLFEKGVPTFVLTRGTLVTRDKDILSKMAEEGQVEVCFSLITLNEAVTSALEPGAPPPSERLAAARELAAEGIPVSFHIAPLIPGLDSEGDLEELAETALDAGASHLFTAMFGARPGYWTSFVELLHSLRAKIRSWETFRAAYPPDFVVDGDAAVTCAIEHAVPVLMPIRAAAFRARAPFISENYPAFSTAALEGGIYRWKLPTVYDMAEWIGARPGPVAWDEFWSGYYAAFAPSDVLAHRVKSLWEDGTLFVGSRIEMKPGERIGYQGTDHDPSAYPTATLVTRRRAFE
jgi:DNA repair photolyase